MSESLDTLDERWKAGSFRYLMPDFRARVHRGENFVIAGDRFAIGSSREMSPAGLKGVAEEAGLQMVIVCGQNMGDIFRRNSFNLGLHVVQSPEAVADAQDGDEFTFDPASRQLRNVTRGKTYEPVPLSPKEEEIRRSGGIFEVGRREFRKSVITRPSVDWPERTRPNKMTTTEQIVWAHRVDKDLSPAELTPGTTVRVYADLLPASDGTAPFSIHTFNQITGGSAIYPRQAAIANDHFVFTGVDADDKQTSIGREFARLHAHREALLRDPRRRHLSLLLPGAGPGDARAVHPGRRLAQPRVRRLRCGRDRRRIDDARVRMVDGLYLLHARRQRRVVFRGQLQPWVSGKDIVLELLRQWGAKQSQGMSVELVDADKQLPIAYRNTIANMMAEAEAQNGIFAPDEITYAWYRQKGLTELPYPPIAPGPQAIYEIDEAVDLTAVQPMIAKPFSPGNAFPAAEVAREHITFDKAMIGSCTNGSYDDLLQAALVLRAARARGAKTVERELAIFPGSGGVGRQIERPDPRLGGESIAEVFRSVGGGIRQSWCGPCFGQGPDALTTGQRAITSFNRNWQNRMGFGGEGYLASPAVVAASALLGFMAPPSELGLVWEPEAFGV